MCVCPWRPEDNPGCPSSAAIALLFLRRIFHWDLQLACYAGLIAQGLPSFSSLCRPVLALKAVIASAGLLHGFWGSNSASHTCMTSTSLTETSSQLGTFLLLMWMRGMLKAWFDTSRLQSKRGWAGRALALCPFLSFLNI